MSIKLQKEFLSLLVMFISLDLAASVTHIWPSSGLDDTTITVHIYGDDFYSGVTNINLYRAGIPTINASDIQLVNDNYLTCKFDLQAAAANTYNLIVNDDTLGMCFTVNSYVWNLNYWDQTDLGPGSNVMLSVALGDGNNDGELEVYGANYGGNIYQYYWDGTNWSRTDVGIGGNTWGVAVGDGNNDGILEIYGVRSDGNIYQFSWNGSNWFQTDFNNTGNQMFGVAVGDGNNDGKFEVYGANADGHIYQFSWNNGIWNKTDLGSGVGGNYMWGVTVGDGNNDGELEVYGANWDNHLYQFKWNSISWDKTDLGSGGNLMRGVAVGDGNNDGDVEVYGANWDNHLYQFKWNGISWDKTDLGSNGYQVWGVAVGDGNNDGEMEVYGVNEDHHLYQYRWNSISWDQTDLGFGNSYMCGVAVGDGNNDGKLEIYTTNYDFHLYQFKVRPEAKMALSDTSYVFSYTQVNDTLTWQYLGIDNIGDALLIIDSIILINSNFSIINYSFPDTITVNDSAMVEVIFSPIQEGLISGSLAVYSNDPWDPVQYVYLEGIGDSSAPTITNLIYPLNSSYQNNNNIDFIWTESTDTISGISYYELQIAYDVSFSSIVHDTNISDTTVNISLPDSEFFWRVKSVDQAGNESYWSDVWSFEIDTLLPSSPNLSYPISGVFIGNTLVNFSWTEVSLNLSRNNSGIPFRNIWESSRDEIMDPMTATPVSYIIELDSTSTFTVPVFTDILDTNGIELILPQYGYYYWRVKAYDLAGNQSPFSGVDSFGVDITSPVIESTTVWMDTSYQGPFTIYTKVTDYLAVDSVFLIFKRTQDPDWIIQRMNRNGNWYNKDIPQTNIYPDTIKYYIYAQDIAIPANTSFDPSGAPTTCYCFVIDQLGVTQILGTPAVFSFSFYYQSSREVIFNLALPEESYISLKIFDLSGREVSNLVSDQLSPAFYSIPFRSMSSGTYFYRLENSYQDRSGKFIILE